VPNSVDRGVVCACRRNGHLYQSTESVAVQNGGMQEQDRSQMLYPQIAESIATPIRAGTLARGERVPSVRELARQHRVSLGTVLQAYRLLDRRGCPSPKPRTRRRVRWRST
jgi:DNA-binding FadR family transcriptional regulator